MNAKRVVGACARDAAQSEDQTWSTHTKLAFSASPLAVSGPLSLSFQSSLHLSLTVLLRYRSLADI